MKRRKFLIGAGSLAAGSAAATGTGAFSQMRSGNRAVDVEVRSDSDAYVSLAPWQNSDGEYGPNAAYAGGNGDERGGADGSGGFDNEKRDTLALDFTEDNPNQFSFGGDGVNKGSVYEFDNVFEILNYGTQDVDIWLTKSDLSGVYFYGTKNGTGTDPSNSLLGKANRTGSVSVSQSVGVGVKIVADELNVNSLGEIVGNVQVRAQASTQLD